MKLNSDWLSTFLVVDLYWTSIQIRNWNLHFRRETCL